MKMKLTKTLTALLGLMLAGPALAQVAPRPVLGKKAAPPAPAATNKQQGKKAQQGTKTKPPGPQRVDFTKGDLVEAGIDTGTGDIVHGRTSPRLSRLIPVRTDFRAELIKSAEDL